MDVIVREYHQFLRTKKGNFIQQGYNIAPATDYE